MECTPRQQYLFDKNIDDSKKLFKEIQRKKKQNESLDQYEVLT